MQQQKRTMGIALSSIGLLVLSACGGGGGGDSPATPVTTTFSGVAATGKAMANADIAITCASGSGTTKASDNGSYTKNIASVTLPCALQATGSDGTVLYSVTSATATSSNTQVAHITPLTQLLVASLTGTNPTTFFSTVSTTPTSITTVVNDNAIATAQTAVLAILADAGISTTSLPNLINGSLVAGSAGSVYDVALDALQTTISTTGTTLTTLTTAAAAANPTSTPTTGAASLPANLLLKPAASNCSALRSGEYVTINPRRGSTLADQTGTVSFNASTLAWTDTSHPDGGGTMATNGDCSYTIDSDTYVVSQAGILMGTNTEAGVKGLSIIFPKQTIAVSELAGTWNMAGIEADGSSPLNNGTVTIDSSGLATTLTDCDGAAPGGACETVTSTATNGIRVSSNSAGGFDLVSTLVGEAWTDRVFAYRAGSGHLMLVSVSGDGSLTLLTKQRILGLPTVGDVGVGSWDLTINNQLQAGSFNSNALGSTVTATDASSSSVTYMQKTTAGADDYITTVVQNSPRDGFNYRAAGTTTSVFDGRTVTVRARASLNMRGMGVGFQLVPHSNSLRMYVDMAVN